MEREVPEVNKKVVQTDYRGAMVWLEIRCPCGLMFQVRADKGLVVCPNCGDMIKGVEQSQNVD